VANQFSSFEDALHKLELEEEDLKRLISAGEIRAFREGSKMHLRAEDVDKVAKQLGVGSSVSEKDASRTLEVEDLSLGAAGEQGMSTTQLSEEDTLLDDLETVDVGAEAAAPAAVAGRRNKPAVETGQREGTGMLFAAIATAVLLVFAIPFSIGMLSARSTGLTSGLVGMFQK
jgi:hypothetical protein